MYGSMIGVFNVIFPAEHDGIVRNSKKLKFTTISPIWCRLFAEKCIEIDKMLILSIQKATFVIFFREVVISEQKNITFDIKKH